MVIAYGTTISWKGSLQKVVTFSTIEGEYITMTKAVKKSFIAEESSQRVEGARLGCHCLL